MNKSAQEMFKELGYYYQPNCGVGFFEYSKGILPAIAFNLGEKTIEKKDYDIPYITVKELQAINKQIEEFGWNK